MSAGAKRRLVIIGAALSASIIGMGVGASAFGSSGASQIGTDVPATPGTPEPRPRIGGWPNDVNGDGLISDTGAERIPELIKAAGDNGVEGYVRYDDLEGGPQPSNPAEAVAMSGQTRVIPLYAADGVTVIGTFTMGSASVPSSVPTSAPAPSGKG